MSKIFVQDISFLLILLGLAWPLGNYITRVMGGKRVLLTPVLAPVEKLTYRILGVTDRPQTTGKQYMADALTLGGVSLVVVFLLQLAQGILPANPQGFGGVEWTLAFNTAASFVSNTNWQAYAGETTMSYLTQAMGLTVQNFVSAAAGIATLFALIRGFTQKQKGTIGSFWHDLTRVTLYVLLPLSLVVAIILCSQGVVQSLAGYREVSLLESGAMATVPLGPAASQIAIKQLGTNGGGFFGANSAFPLENPNALSNLVQTLSLLIIPAALCFSFGKAVKSSKQGRALLTVMLIFFVVLLVCVTLSEVYLVPHFAQTVGVGNMEGKETVHGVGGSALWGVVTTSVSNGAVNAMHDSFTPLGGMGLMFLMQLGEVVFGGVGSGMYGMIAFVLLTVFIAGLMVGRTPEYLGKKIEPFEMKMVCLMVLTLPLLTLLGTAAAVVHPQVTTWLTNSGAHGFSEILYAFTSMANNNGSAFAGYAANTPFTNLLGGVIMLVSRFVPMAAAILLGGSLARKKNISAGEGTLSTTNGIFVGMLVGVILLVGALSFLPALALGPIADFFTAAL